MTESSIHRTVPFVAFGVSICVGLLSNALSDLAPGLAIFAVASVTFVIFAYSQGQPRGLTLLTPLGLAVMYLALAVGLVPLFWSLGWADPWEEVQQAPLRAAWIATAVFVAFVAGGTLAGAPHKPKLYTLSTPRRQLRVVLVAGILIGCAGYFSLAALAGGPAALITSLADRRDLLAGTGPLRGLLLVTAVTCVYGVMHRDKLRVDSLLTALAGGVYVLATLATGARLGVITLVIAVFVAWARSGASTRRVWRTSLFLSLAAIPASTFYALKVRTGLTYGIDVRVVDTTTTTDAINSLLGPFTAGGLDTIRTVGVTDGTLPLMGLRPELLAGSFGNLVPRYVWPDKPPGSATQFSQIYFPRLWSEGTGVPPSLGAEFLHSFGLIGGLVTLTLFGFLFARISSWLTAHPESVFLSLVAPFVAANSLELVKGGSDGFVRLMFLWVLAVFVVYVIARVAGTYCQTADAKLTGRGYESGLHKLARTE